MYTIEALARLQDWFSRLPGIGPKSAARLAYYVIQMPAEEVKEFAQDMYRARLQVRNCSVCGNLTDGEICSICQDDTRDSGTLCVVKDTRDVMALERTREYRGLYHVLGGTIAPLEGVGPEDLRIDELVTRVKKGNVKEVILATNPDVQGEATAVYIGQLLQPLGVKVTRIAHGVPVGGELEYTDEVTLTKSLEGRHSF